MSDHHDPRRDNPDELPADDALDEPVGERPVAGQAPPEHAGTYPPPTAPTQPAAPVGTVVETVGTAPDPATDALAAMQRRMNLLVGALAVLLLGSFVVIGLLFARIASTQSELDEFTANGGASSAQLQQIQDDLDRVEAGAALYASQIEGFQQTLTELSPQIAEGVDTAITGLREFSSSTLSFDVPIDETIPIDTEIAIKRTITVPIKTEIPINQTIETTIKIDSLGGLPLDISVPIDLVVPIDLDVDIPIDETIPISEEFPVQLDVPLDIDVGQTELANLTDALATGLESLQDIIDGLAG